MEPPNLTGGLFVLPWIQVRAKFGLLISTHSADGSSSRNTWFKARLLIPSLYQQADSHVLLT